jgi:geranylgeranyl diphosphate synthase type II
LEERATAVRSFDDIVHELSGLIESALDRVLTFGSGAPPRLVDALRYAVFSGGKRVRPILALLAARACGASPQLALPVACAVELVHCYSLVHDDLPAMDNDDYRRGRPTCHRAYGEALAILVGDGLLARAFEILATELSPPEVAAACCATLARAAGPENLVGGQADDMGIGGAFGAREEELHESGFARSAGESTSGGGSQQEENLQNAPAGRGRGKAGIGQNLPAVFRDRRVEIVLGHVRSIHARKTGALIWAAVRMGGLVAQAGEPQLEALDRYGQNLGLAFQIVDDLLDASGDSGEVGKRVGKDLKQGKWTYPGVVGIEASRREAERLIQEACQAISPLGDRAAELVAVAQFVLQRRK